MGTSTSAGHAVLLSLQDPDHLGRQAGRRDEDEGFAPGRRRRRGRLAEQERRRKTDQI